MCVRIQDILQCSCLCVCVNVFMIILIQWNWEPPLLLMRERRGNRPERSVQRGKYRAGGVQWSVFVPLETAARPIALKIRHEAVRLICLSQVFNPAAPPLIAIPRWCRRRLVMSPVGFNDPRRFAKMKINKVLRCTEFAIMKSMHCLSPVLCYQLRSF